MIVSKICIIIGGCLTILMVVFHVFFPKIFKWEKDFQRITGTNKRIFFTINIALFLFFIIVSIITLVHVNELIKCEGISFSFLLLMSIFWLWRTIWQIIYFKPDKNSKLLLIHFVLIAIFFILFISYSLPIVLR